VPYDVLVLAAGGRTNYWNVPGAEAFTMPFREIAHADALRRRMIEVLDKIPPSSAPQDIRSALTFAIVGGGASGCELATKMSDLLRDACYRRALKGEPRILIIEMTNEIVPGMDEIREIVEKALTESRIEVHLQTKVTSVEANSLTVEHNGEQSEIKTAATIWVAGVRVNPLIEKLNFEKTKNGLIVIEPTLRVKGQENVFALGDISYLADVTPTLAGTSQLAFQQAKVLADNIKAFINGKELKTKHFEELGEAVSLGVENAAVLAEGKTFSGTLARQARFALYTTRMPTWHHRLKVGASWFFEGTSPRPLQSL
jgi:NADH dehydrogenase